MSSKALVVKAKAPQREVDKEVNRRLKELNLLSKRERGQPLEERMETLALNAKIAEAKRLQSKVNHQARQSAQRKNPHYQALIEEYGRSGVLPARVSNSGDPVNDTSYIEDIVRSHIMRGTPLDELKTTAYVKALVDPETSGERQGVPDLLPIETFRYQSITEIEIGSEYFNYLGDTVIVTTPDIVDHVLLPVSNANGEIYSFINASHSPFGRSDDLFDTNLVDPATAVPVNTPDQRIHFPGGTEFAGETRQVTLTIVPNSQYLLQSGTGGAAGTVFDVNVISKTLNPGRLITYPFQEADDGLRSESMWSVDSSASTVDKFMFPSQVTFDGITPHLVYPMYAYFTAGRPQGTSDFPRIHVRGVATPLASMVNNVGTGTVSRQIIVIVSIHGYELGSGGAAINGTPIDLHYMTSVNAGFPGLSNLNNTNISIDPIPFDIRIDRLMAATGPFSFTCTRASGSPEDISSYIAIDSISVGTLAFTLDTEWSLPIQTETRVDEIQFAIEVGGQTINTVNTRGQPFAGPDAYPGAWNPFQVGCIMGAYSVDQLQNFASGLWTKYRPVSMSSWLTYVGGTLNDIGEIYGSFIADRRFVSDRDHNYLTPSGIASIANAYRGKAPLGAYAIWKPLAERDLDLRSLASKWNFDRGFTAIAVTSGPDLASQNYVLRVVANYEVVTLAATFRLALQESVIDQTQLWGAFQILKGFPMVMANDDHDSAISNFFSSLWSGIKKGAAFVSKNIGPIKKVAETLGEFA